MEALLCLADMSNYLMLKGFISFSWNVNDDDTKKQSFYLISGNRL